MSLFTQMFRRGGKDSASNQGSGLMPESINYSETSEATPSIERNEFVSDNSPRKYGETIDYGTGCAIDAIYSFITRDYEEQGYQDALVNGDMSYRNTKEELLRNSLKSLFEQVKIRYNDDIRRLEVQIRTAEEQMVTTAAQMLKSQIETYRSHLQEIAKMEKDLEQGSPKMTLMIDSYTRGFLKGISAQSMGLLNNGN